MAAVAAVLASGNAPTADAAASADGGAPASAPAAATLATLAVDEARVRLLPAAGPGAGAGALAKFAPSAGADDSAGAGAALAPREAVAAAFKALDDKGTDVGAGLGLTLQEKQQIINQRAVSQLQLYLIIGARIPLDEELYERLGTRIAALLPSSITPDCPGALYK
ncbi:hypothetical protein EON68_00435, partial [archaeon]